MKAGRNWCLPVRGMYKGNAMIAPPISESVPMDLVLDKGVKKDAVCVHIVGTHVLKQVFYGCLNLEARMTASVILPDTCTYQQDLAKAGSDAHSGRRTGGRAAGAGDGADPQGVRETRGDAEGQRSGRHRQEREHHGRAQEIASARRAPLMRLW